MKHSHSHNHHESEMHTPESNTVEYLKFFGVVVFILSASYFFYSNSETTGLLEYSRWFMGMFMLTFAGFKFAGYKMFVMMFPAYDLVAKKSKIYPYLYPFIQLILSLYFLFDILPVYREFFTLIIGTISAVGVYHEVYMKKNQVKCACLGNIIKLPLSTVSFFEDLVMAIMAIFMLII